MHRNEEAILSKSKTKNVYFSIRLEVEVFLISTWHVHRSTYTHTHKSIITLHWRMLVNYICAHTHRHTHTRHWSSERKDFAADAFKSQSSLPYLFSWILIKTSVNKKSTACIRGASSCHLRLMRWHFFLFYLFNMSDFENKLSLIRHGCCALSCHVTSCWGSQG